MHNFQKHLGIYLDEILNFNLDIEEIMSKAMKEISAIEKANKNLRRYFLATIYVLFVIPHLDMAMKVSLKKFTEFNESYSYQYKRHSKIATN